MSNNYLCSMYCGDTYLDIYGSVDEDDHTVGHVGGIDIEDVRIAESEISVLEMIHGLNWAKFNQEAHEAYAGRNDA